MKRFLILAVVALGTFAFVNAENVVTNSIDSVYHDGKSIVTTIYNDSKSAIGELYPDIKAAIVQIGKAIGVAAEHVYTVLVKKYFVTGVKSLCVLLTGIALFFLGYRKWNKYTQETGLTYRVLMPGLLMIISIFMVASINYDEMFMGLINPEYGAIKYILEYTKTAMNS